MSTAGQLLVLYIRPRQSAFPLKLQFLQNLVSLNEQDSSPEALVSIYSEQPQGILISSEIPNWQDFVIEIKNNSWFQHIPVLVLIENGSQATAPNWALVPFDDCILLENHEKDVSAEIFFRLQIRQNRLSIQLESNPLTRLPGNNLILSAIRHELSAGSGNSICYLDIDNFKAFNDSYGFAAGDDMIRMTGQVLKNTISRFHSPDEFIGHIGGDDFIFIVPKTLNVECCQQIITNFELVTSSLYKEEDIQKGTIDIANRHGVLETFPLPTISIAIVDMASEELTSIGEITKLASILKKKLKLLPGSNFLVGP